MRFIVTDLTRFSSGDKACLAGFDSNSKKTVRPLPYLTVTECKTHNILPGSILEMGLTPSAGASAPHVEDMDRKAPGVIKVFGTASGEDFENALKATLHKSINAGFDGEIPNGEKYVPYASPPGRSLITVKVPVDSVEVVSDSYKAGKIKLHVNDGDRIYNYLPITDLGFYSLASAKIHDLAWISTLNEFIRKQKKLYLRIGLSRVYAPNRENDTRHGFWVQVNGIYTFPNFMSAARKYR